MLIWWGNAIIVAGGMGIAYVYYSHTPDFVANPDRSSLNGYNKSATITFLTMALLNLLIYISFISGRPFKKPLYTNKPLVALISFFFCLMTIFHFLT
jgi:hypothetical protein